MLQLFRYSHERDESSLVVLWQTVFDHAGGKRWPITPNWLREVALAGGRSKEYLMAEVDGQTVGFALAQVNEGAPLQGSLLALGVHPDFRRRGIGRVLQEAALERLHERGVTWVQLGAGGMGYFWPGVPADAPEAWPFFKAMGWAETERSFDLARSLEDYQTPAWVWERVSGLGVSFVTADAAGLGGQAVAFVKAEQPGWETFFAQAVREDRAQDVLLAVRAESNQILGACLVESPYPRWALCFEQPLGTPGCILTAHDARGQGIGMALTARATEILQERGCRSSFLGWTWLVDWYGKLGYTVWQEYVMSWRGSY